MPKNSPRVANLAGELRGCVRIEQLDHIRRDNGRSIAVWRCVCECGVTILRTTNELNRKGYYLSCGCQTEIRRGSSIRAAAAKRLASNPQWQVNGDEAFIDFGEAGQCVIDAADLPIAKNMRWHVVINRSGLRYVQSTTQPKVFLHVLLMGRKLVDHADGDGLNNRRLNLRLCTSAQNQANQRKQAGTKSQYKGVRPPSKWRKGWACEIECKGVRYYLGTFKTERDAAIAYDRKAIELFGDFARLNFPKEVAGV